VLIVRLQSANLILWVLSTAAVASLLGVPVAFAQSPEVSAEWALFNQILIIGIAVGIVVFGIMFYAIIRYREKPQSVGAK
jgi:heme/copper-type cytochrome/quinol oxidase subunit 2